MIYPNHSYPIYSFFHVSPLTHIRLTRIRYLTTEWESISSDLVKTLPSGVKLRPVRQRRCLRLASRKPVIQMAVTLKCLSFISVNCLLPPSQLNPRSPRRRPPTGMPPRPSTKLAIWRLVPPFLRSIPTRQMSRGCLLPSSIWRRQPLLQPRVNTILLSSPKRSSTLLTRSWRGC